MKSCKHPLIKNPPKEREKTLKSNKMSTFTLEGAHLSKINFYIYEVFNL